MKKISKFLGILLIIALVMSFGVSAFAAGEYQITIENTNTNMSIAGKTYSAYKVFDLTYGPDADNDGKPDSYAYSIKNTDWAWATLTDGATTDSTTGKITTKYGIILTPSAADPTLYSVDKGTMADSDARDLADALVAVLPTTADGTITVPNTATTYPQSATIAMDEPGYYAVYGVVFSTDPYYDGSDTAHTAPEVVAALALTAAVTAASSEKSLQQPSTLALIRYLYCVPGVTEVSPQARPCVLMITASKSLQMPSDRSSLR